MDTMQAARRYEARPGRAAVVAGSLADLHGPTEGKVTLPLRMFWGPEPTFDLSVEGMREWMYRTVLREAVSPDELAEFLDGDTLVELWPGLYLPKGVRRAWEERHPRLREAAAAAAA
jgi:hypothetical protein